MSDRPPLPRKELCRAASEAIELGRTAMLYCDLYDQSQALVRKLEAERESLIDEIANVHAPALESANTYMAAITKAGNHLADSLAEQLPDDAFGDCENELGRFDDWRKLVPLPTPEEPTPAKGGE